MVERRPLRHNIAKKRVILLNLRLLAILHGIAEKKAGLLFPIKIVLKGENIGELSTVIRKHHGHKVRKSKTACRILLRVNPISDLLCGIYFGNLPNLPRHNRI